MTLQEEFDNLTKEWIGLDNKRKYNPVYIDWLKEKMNNLKDKIKSQEKKL